MPDAVLAMSLRAASRTLVAFAENINHNPKKRAAYIIKNFPRHGAAAGQC